MNPSLTVVVAVYNGAHFLPRCLSAILAAADAETEILLVDDGSTDDSTEIGRRLGMKVITLARCTGAANARNSGAQEARSELILFVDADVVVQANTVSHLRRIFSENPECSAVFGSYDDSPGEPDFFSQYRNLMHHFFHQTGSRDAQTFWSGLGAVRREDFLRVGGFDARKYQAASVEDIDLGYRLRENGCRILLAPDLQAKHLKRWTLRSIIRTDFWQRGVPWAELMLRHPDASHELNVKMSQKLSALLVVVSLSSLALSLLDWRFLVFTLGSLIALIIVNKDFYGFFRRRKGVWFVLRVFPMHLLYFCYSSLAFAYSWIDVKIHRPVAAFLRRFSGTGAPGGKPRFGDD